MPTPLELKTAAELARALERNAAATERANELREAELLLVRIPVSELAEKLNMPAAKLEKILKARGIVIQGGKGRGNVRTVSFQDASRLASLLCLKQSEQLTRTAPSREPLWPPEEFGKQKPTGPAKERSSISSIRG